MTGNYAIMLATALVGMCLLVIIEADLFQSCAKFSLCKKPEPRQIVPDPDVLQEQQRVENGRDDSHPKDNDDSNNKLLDTEDTLDQV